MENLERPLSDFCCLNENCPEHGKKNAGNIRIEKVYGKNKDIRLLVCKVCKKTFSERKNTSLFNSKLPKEKVTNIIHHLAEGVGIRKTSRLTKVSKDTVLRYSKISGEHSKSIHDELVRDLEVEEVELDEKWNFVEKKDKNIDEGVDDKK